MYDTKGIFSAHIMCMVHTPFKEVNQAIIVLVSVFILGQEKLIPSPLVLSYTKV